MSRYSKAGSIRLFDIITIIYSIVPLFFIANHIDFFLLHAPVTVLAITAYIFGVRRFSILGTYAYITILSISFFLISVEIGFDTGFFMYYFVLPPGIALYVYDMKHQAKKDIHTWPMWIIIVLALIATYDTQRLVQPQVNLIEDKVWLIFKVNTVVVMTMTIICLIKLRSIIIKTELLSLKNANTDMLTGLANRRSFLYSIEKSDCRDMSHVAVAMLDIDNFKQFNDKYGHKAGDLALQLLGKLLLSIEGDSIKTCRWGGEEFVIYAECDSSKDVLVQKLKALQDTLQVTPIVFDSYSLNVMFTAGVTKYHTQDTIDSIINRADTYLYIGKKNCKGTIVTNPSV